MEFKLSERLLRFKENSYAETFLLDCGGINVVGLSSAAQEKRLDCVFDAFEEKGRFESDEQFQEITQFILSSDQLSVQVQKKVAETVSNIVKITLFNCRDYQESAEVDSLRYLWEQIVLLVYIQFSIAERRATAKVAAVPTKSTATTASSGRNKKKEKDSDSSFDWDQRREDFLRCSVEILALPLTIIWPLLHQRAPFVSVFMEMVGMVLETEVNLKNSVLKSLVVDISKVCIVKYNQAQSFQTTLIQNLRYSTHLSEFMAETLYSTLKHGEVPGLVDNIFREIGQSKFSADDKTAKEFSKFLIRFAELCPRESLKYLSMIMDLIDCEAYSIRCAMIELFGFIMTRIALGSSEEDASKNQAVNLCMVLEERLLDVSSYCRTRVLKTFHLLSDFELPVSEYEDLTDQPRVRNAIPLSRRLHIVEAAIDRLHDKTAAVRKEALRLLSKFIETHPFWLDGGLLDLALFERKRKELQDKLESMSPKDIVSVLKDALPESAKEAMKMDNIDIGGESSENDPGKLYVEPEEIERVEKQLIYYYDAVRFTKQMTRAARIICELIASKTKSDVIESIFFFTEAKRHELQAANDGIKRMVHLIWSKDVGDNETKSIREYLLQAYVHLYLEVDGEDDKERAKKIVKNLIILTFNGTLAELTSLEQLLSTLMSRGSLSDEVVSHLWAVFGSSKTGMPVEQRRGAIILLGMLAKDNPSFIKEHMSLLVKIGFGQHGFDDLQIARYTCIALQKLGYTRNLKKKSDMSCERLSNDHFMLTKLRRLILTKPNSIEWFMFCEQALNLVYSIADQPDIWCSSLIKRITDLTFGLNQSDTENPSSELDKSTSSKIKSTELASLVFVVGHVAIKQIAHMEVVESELKTRDASSTSEKKKTKAEELDDVVGSVEDDVGDQMQYIRDHEILFGQDGLLTVFGPIISHICINHTIYKSPILQRMVALSLCKFMCVSEKFAEQNLSLLFTLLAKSSDISTRSNAIIGVGDLAVCFGNLIDQNISFLYDRLRDSNRDVKKNALMVLTHLVLNGMVKVKGQISELAVCLEDPDERISDLAKLFFTELASKDNSIYNNLPDIISGLSMKRGVSLDETRYNNIMKFLLAFIDKDKQAENITEKLCQRFKTGETPQVWRDIAYCLSLLHYKSDRSIKKLMEALPYYQDKLHDEQVYNYFMDIIAKCRKTGGGSSVASGENRILLDEFEQKLAALHKTGKVDAEAIENASQASNTFNQWEKLEPSNVLEETKAALENLKINNTPVKTKSKKPASSLVKKKPKPRAVAADSESEDDYSEAKSRTNRSKRITKAR